MSRVARLQPLLEQRELDGLIVSTPANLFYVTGYTGSNGVALVNGNGGPHRFLTDFRYETQVAAQLDDAFEAKIVTGDLLEALAPTLPAARVGFDDASVSVRDHERIREGAGAGTELVAAAGLVEELRLIKDEDELERIRAAAQLTDSIYEWLLGQRLEGRAERDVAIELEHEMRRRGAQAPSFPSIVVGGTRGALPHGTPSDAPLERGTLVTIDIGAQLDGYCADCTRTFAIGEEPGEEARAVYELVLQAQIAGVDAVRAGPRGREVDAVARAVIDEGGYGERFGHGLGHGVGIEVHEAPKLSRHGGEEPLREGAVVTVEPGIYVPERFGVRIEDLVVVTADGCEVLSGFAKELLVVD
jgi:Xaa-Pro aminopeptidase